MGRTAEFLSKNIDWFEYENELEDKGIEERFIKLWDSCNWGKFSLFDWATKQLPVNSKRVALGYGKNKIQSKKQVPVVYQKFLNFIFAITTSHPLRIGWELIRWNHRPNIN